MTASVLCAGRAHHFKWRRAGKERTVARKTGRGTRGDVDLVLPVHVSRGEWPCQRLIRRPLGLLQPVLSRVIPPKRTLVICSGAIAPNSTFQACAWPELQGLQHAESGLALQPLPVSSSDTLVWFGLSHIVEAATQCQVRLNLCIASESGVSKVLDK